MNEKIKNFFKPNVDKLKKRRNVKKLIRLLHSKDYDITIESIAALGEIGATEAIDDLIGIFMKSCRKTCLIILEALKKIGDLKVVVPLCGCLRYIRSDLAVLAADIAANILERDCTIEFEEELAKRLTKSPPDLIWTITRKLYNTGYQPKTTEFNVIYWIYNKQWDKFSDIDSATVDFVINIAKNLSFATWKEIFEVLRKNNRVAADTFIKQTVRLCEKDIEKIMSISDVNAVIPLLESLAAKVRKNSDYFYDEYFEPVMDAIKTIGSPAVQTLLNTFSSFSAKRHHDTLVRTYAVVALGRIGDPSAVERLIEVLEIQHDHITDNTIKGFGIKASTIALALGDIGDSRAVESLIYLLDSDSQYGHTRAAFQALVQIGEPAVTPLLQALDDNSWRDQHRYILKHIRETLMAIRENLRNEGKQICEELESISMPEKCASDMGLPLNQGGGGILF